MESRFEWVEAFTARARRDLSGGVTPYRGAPAIGAPLVPKAIPRLIWIYWAQGWTNAPVQSRHCLDSWRRHNPGWTLRMLDDETIAQFSSFDRGQFAAKQMTMVGFSNLLRLDLLKRHGGVWVDASTFCSRPLDEWLICLLQSGFFAFSRPGPDRLLSTWFLASEPGGYVVGRWLELLSDYWMARDQSEFYHWTHYLFAEGCRFDPTLKRLWEQTPWVSADGPHQVQANADRTHDIDEILESIAARRVPIHKLETRRQQLPSPEDRTPLGRLLYDEAPRT